MARARHRLVAPVVLAALAIATPLCAQRGGGGGGGVGQAGSESFNTVTAAAHAKAPPPPVPITVMAVAFPIGGALDDQIALLVEVGGRELLTDNPSGDLAGEIVAKASDASGKVVDQLT